MTKLSNNILLNKRKLKKKALITSVLSFLNPTKLDILGKEFQFKYSNSSEKYQTLPGGILSVICVGAILIILVSSFLNMIDRGSPEVSVSTQTLPVPPEFDLYNQSLLSPLSLSTFSQVLPPSEVMKYVTPRLIVEVLQVNPGNGLPVYSHQANIPLVPCTEVADKTIMESFRKANQRSFQMANNFGLCPDTQLFDKRFNASGRFETPPFKTVHLVILPCSLPDRTQCKAPADLKGLTISHVISKKAFDATNYTEPVTFLPQFDGQYGLDIKNRKDVNYMLRRNKIFDSKFDFFDASLKAEYDDYYLFGTDFRERDASHVYCSKSNVEDLQSWGCEPYMVISYQATGEVKKITRTYPKLFGTLGEVGGAAEILLIVSTLIYAWYNERKLEARLRKDISGGVTLEMIERYFGIKKQQAKPQEPGKRKIAYPEVRINNENPLEIENKREEERKTPREKGSLGQQENPQVLSATHSVEGLPSFEKSNDEKNSELKTSFNDGEFKRNETPKTDENEKKRNSHELKILHNEERNKAKKKYYDRNSPQYAPLL